MPDPHREIPGESGDPDGSAGDCSGPNQQEPNCCKICNSSKRIAELEAALAEEGKDTERLDWLGRGGALSRSFIEGYGWIHLDREGIDAARAEADHA